MDVKPLIGAFGAQIKGLDLSSGLDDATRDELHKLFLKHRLLVIRDQSLDAAGVRDIGARFGSLDVHPFIQSIPGIPEVIPVVKEADATQNFGGGWHAEVSFYEAPAMATLLYAVDIPPVGGDTLVSDCVMAYAALAEKTKARIDGLTALHTAKHIYGPGGFYEARSQDGASGTKTKALEQATATTRHPAVRTHPETGEKILYVNGAFVWGFDGISEPDGLALRDALAAQTSKAEFVSRIRWEPGTLVMWDNRSTQHYALNDYQGHRREMLRVVIEGDQPY